MNEILFYDCKVIFIPFTIVVKSSGIICGTRKIQKMLWAYQEKFRQDQQI